MSSTEFFQLSFRGPKKVFNKDGELVETRPRIKAVFRHSGMPEWATRQAVSKLVFLGLPEGRAPEQNLSVFDSVEAQRINGWTDEEREALEAWLAERQVFNSYIKVEPEKAPKPWATYDRLVAKRGTSAQDTADKIAFLTQETGVDPDVVLAYERENLARDEVIQAVEALSAPAPDDETVVAA